MPLRRLLGAERTWTGRQLSAALRADGLALGPRPDRRSLERIDAGDRRTAATVGHTQDPAQAAWAGRVLDAVNKQRRRVA
jgi:hypothetical protein